MAAIGGGESTGYAQEPETSGKVLVVTTLGEFDVELWSKETPLTCRNFVQLCLEGYYDGVIFHRIIKDFMAQTGDPTGTGQGGESIYGQPFKDEFHARLRPTRRGIVGMANQETPHTNTSQFFITLGNCDWLQKKNTIFGKITGKTIYNIIPFNDFDCDPATNRPLHQPPRIIRTEVLHNPFPDIVPRQKILPQLKPQKPSKKDKKNFSLLSFGEEEEVEEQKVKNVAKVVKSVASKSSHDLLEDEKLSKQPVVIPSKAREAREEEGEAQDEVEDSKRRRVREETEEHEDEDAENGQEKSGLSAVKSRLAHLASEKRKEEPKKNKTTASNDKDEEDEDVVDTTSKHKQTKISKEQQQLVQDIKNIAEAKKKRIEREQDVKMSSTRTTAFKINPGLSRDAELLSPLEIRRQKFVQRSSRTKNREKDVLSKLAQFKVAIQAPKFQPNPKETDEEKREESKRLMLRGNEEGEEEQSKKTGKEDEEARKKQQKEDEIQKKKELFIKLRAEEKQAKKERLEALEKEEQEKQQEAREKDRRRGKKDGGGDKKTLFPETSGGIEIMPSSLLSDEEEDDDGDEGWMTHKVRFLHRPQDIKKDMDNFEKDYSVFDPRDKHAKPDRVVKAKQGQDRLIGFDKQRHSAYQEALQDELQPLDNVDLDRLVEEGLAKRKARAAGKPDPQSSSSTQVSFGAGIYKQALKADKFSFFRDRDTEPADEAETFKKFGGKKGGFTDSAKPQTDYIESNKPSATDERLASPPRKRHSRSHSRGKGSRRSHSKPRRSRSKEPKKDIVKDKTRGSSKERKRSHSRERKKRSRSNEKKRSRSRDHKKHNK